MSRDSNEHTGADYAGDSEQRLRAFADASSDVVYRLSPDWSEVLYLQGQGFSIDTPVPHSTWFDTYIHPEDQPRVTEQIREAIRTKCLFELEHRVIRMDGTLGWNLSRVVPLLDEDGEIIEWFGTARDVTGRKQAEDALREREMRLQLALDAAAVGTFVWYPREESGWSDARSLSLFGLAPGDALNFGHMDDLIPAEDRPLHREAMERALDPDGDGVLYSEHRIIRPSDGALRWIISRGQTQFAGEPAEAISITGVCFDITERKHHEDISAFVDDIMRSLAGLTNIEKTMTAVAEKIGEHFNLSHCLFVEIDESEELATASHGWHRQDLPGLFDTYRMASYMTPEFQRACRCGETVVVRDVFADPLTDGPRYWSLNIGAFIAVPLVRGGDWRFLLAIYDSEPRAWGNDEIALIRNIAGRIWTRLEQARAEHALSESEQRYRSLFESINEGFCVIEMLFDEAGEPVDYCFLQTNPAFETQTGLVAAQGKTMLELEPNHETHWFELYGRVARTGEPARFTEEARYLGERVFDVHAYRFGALEQRRVAILFEDITERRRAERLRKQQARLLELIATDASLEACLNALCLAMPQIGMGLRASILMADEARATFQPPIAPELQPAWGEGLTGAQINEPMSGTCGEAVCRGQTVICEDTATDERWSPEWRALCAANGVRAAYSVPVWNADGDPVASFMLCFDRTRGPSAWEQELAGFGSRVTSIALAHNQANVLLHEANRRKDEFLATLAHELRNPLAPLRNGLEIMRRNDPETTEKARELMTRQLAQLTHLVDDLMDVSRITRGKIELRIAQSDLTAVVREAVETTSSRMDAAGHTLSVALPDEAVTLRADADRLTQGVINLITNAAKYTPANGLIEVGLEQRDDTAVIWVRDNGMGIAADQLVNIFAMFEQAEQPEGRTNEGLGIGLTLVKQVVELHGGTIEAQSEGPGRGSEFIVRLPLAADDPVETSEAEPAAAPPGPLRLLVVDDNHGVSDSMALMLESWGYEARVAHDGYQALDEVAAFQPDAIFLDIGLPGIDGFETAHRLRATPEGRNVLLIALTGWGQEKDRTRTVEAGFDHHLIKPVEPEVLEQLLAELKVQGSQD